MLAFHNDPSLKEFLLAELAVHREADKLVKGEYWQNGRGCAVGCTLHAVSLRGGTNTDFASHAAYETELGIPQIIARLEDRIFEALQNGDSQLWPEKFTSAIRPGADLTMAWPKFALWLLTEEVPQHTKNKRSLAALADVGSLYREWIDGKKPTTGWWLEARRGAAAAAAAEYAAAAAAAAAAADADAAEYAAAAAAADADAAEYAAAAAAAAADADAAEYAAAAAKNASWKRQADKLIEILSAA